MVNTQQSELKTSADLGKLQNRMLAQSQKKAQMTGTNGNLGWESSIF